MKTHILKSEHYILKICILGSFNVIFKEFFKVEIYLESRE